MQAPSNVIVATRFSRLRQLGRDPAPDSNAPCPDLMYEALSVLAESLFCLSKLLQTLPDKPTVDARLAAVRHRTALLEAQMQLPPSTSDERA